MAKRVPSSVAANAFRIIVKGFSMGDTSGKQKPQE
jgi:hypothetical protein